MLSTAHSKWIDRLEEEEKNTTTNPGSGTWSCNLILERRIYEDRKNLTLELQMTRCGNHKSRGNVMKAAFFLWRKKIRHWLQDCWKGSFTVHKLEGQFNFFTCGTIEYLPNSLPFPSPLLGICSFNVHKGNWIALLNTSFPFIKIVHM